MRHISRVVAASGRDAQFSYRYQVVNGKKRYIAEPNKSMRGIHARLIRRLKKVPDIRTILQNSYGALAGGSIMENAEVHQDNQYFYQLDIRDAYPSTPVNWILAYTLTLVDPQLGEVEEVQHFLEDYCIAKKNFVSVGLATGAPASPALFDLYCGITIDAQIRELCHSCAYTRWHDDLTISSKRPIPERLRQKIRSIIRAAGYEIHRQKTSVKDRFRCPITITGVVITRRGKLRPTTTFLDKVDQALAVPLASHDVPLLRGYQGHLRIFNDKREAHYAKVLREDVGQALRWARELGDRKPRQTKRYTPQELDQIRAQAPLAEIIGQYVDDLKPAGGEFKARCPFHNERTPSFTVNEEKGFYHCFGCGAHGDVFRFMTDYKRLTFSAALAYVVKYIAEST